MRARSQRVFTHRGTPTADPGRHRDVKPVWQQVRRLGRLEYTISREHPLIADALAGSSASTVEGILKMIETTLPADLISPRPPAAPPEDAEAETYEVEDVLQAFRTMLAGLPKDPDRRAEMAELLAHAQPFNQFPGLIREVIDSESPEEL